MVFYIEIPPFFKYSLNVAFPPSCQIDWHKGKDVTVKIIKKKQKHKGRGTVRTVTKQVPNDSFFNFFTPIKGNVILHKLHMKQSKNGKQKLHTHLLVG